MHLFSRSLKTPVLKFKERKQTMNAPNTVLLLNSTAGHKSTAGYARLVNDWLKLENTQADRQSLHEEIAGQPARFQVTITNQFYSLIPSFAC